MKQKKANWMKRRVWVCFFFQKCNLIFIISIFWKWICFYKLVTNILEYSGSKSLPIFHVVKKTPGALAVCRWDRVVALRHHQLPASLQWGYLHTSTVMVFKSCWKLLCTFLNHHIVLGAKSFRSVWALWCPQLSQMCHIQAFEFPYWRAHYK